MTKSYWDSQAAKGESVEDRMAVEGNSVESITEQSGDMSCSVYNEPKLTPFSYKPNYKGKGGEGTLEFGEKETVKGYSHKQPYPPVQGHDGQIQD